MFHPSTTNRGVSPANTLSLKSICTVLPSWVKSEKLTSIDFLWLDLQGYELAALRGAKKILQNVSAIHCEVNLVEVYKGAPLYSDLKKWLEEYGFRVEIEAIDWDDGGNVLFVKDKHASN